MDYGLSTMDSPVMVPWPVTIVIVAYAVLATVMGAELWRAASGGAAHLLMPLIWCALCGTLVIGLSLMRPWARRLAVWVSWFLLLATLGSALVAVLHVPPQPRAAIWGTMLAALQALAIRYLTRPHVKHWFVQSVSK